MWYQRWTGHCVGRNWMYQMKLRPVCILDDIYVFEDNRSKWLYVTFSQISLVYATEKREADHFTITTNIPISLRGVVTRIIRYQMILVTFGMWLVLQIHQICWGSMSPSSSGLQTPSTYRNVLWWSRVTKVVLWGISRTAVWWQHCSH